MKFKRKRSTTTYVHLMGGLGNQLFQIAAGINLSMRSNNLLVVDESFGNFRKNRFGTADLNGYGDSKYYRFLKTQSNNKLYSRAIGLQLRLSLNSSSNNLLTIVKKCLTYINSIFLSIILRKKIKIWCASNLGYEEIESIEVSQYLLGYFQTYKFASHEQVKYKLMQLSVSDSSIDLMRDKCLRDKPLIVHVRLTDYLNEPKFGPLSKSYYDDAISMMISAYGFETIYVYSDDIDLAKSFIPKRFFEYCQWVPKTEEDTIVTLEKMRYGHGYILANSSFSWWAAFLSYTINPPIIAPTPWFKGMDEPCQLIPPGWIRVNRD